MNQAEKAGLAANMTFFAIIPLSGCFLCAAIASISDNPSTWLMRATAWLCVVVVRYFCREAN